ncbi:MAG: hypothetical protein ABIP79_01975 [Chitinophagaceae bacterium]
MEIIFTKKEEGQHLINCKREDGTETWMKLSSFFVLHDLMHFVLENEFGFNSAFYGMIESGVAIADFELPKESRKFELTSEAILAEHLVNLLMIECRQGIFENFEETLLKSLKNNPNLIIPDFLNSERIDTVRNKFHNLADKWEALESENNLLLKFAE